jgi:hypothetical protein
VPLERLDRAIHRVDAVDRAIDLGIALEALLMHGSGGGHTDNSPISYRLSLRGAMYLEATHEARKLTFDLLRHVYGLRSTAIHEGHLKATVDKKLTNASLDDGIRKAAALILKIIDTGRMPDWEAVILHG